MFTPLRWNRKDAEPTNQDLTVKEIKVEIFLSHSPYVQALLTYGKGNFDIEPENYRMEALILFVAACLFGFAGLFTLFYREGCMEKPLSDQEKKKLQEFELKDEHHKFIKERKERLERLKLENRERGVKFTKLGNIKRSMDIIQMRQMIQQNLRQGHVNFEDYDQELDDLEMVRHYGIDGMGMHHILNQYTTANTNNFDTQNAQTTQNLNPSTNTNLMSQLDTMSDATGHTASTNQRLTDFLQKRPYN
mmetsp:Transcript_4062/g.6871  ORF Transcript_4062/g.6871 Transcript_4062/m.6871 type:complete len:248 (-) Transcript_4062:861-1604(-)